MHLLSCQTIAPRPGRFNQQIDKACRLTARALRRSAKGSVDQSLPAHSSPLRRASFDRTNSDSCIAAPSHLGHPAARLEPAQDLGEHHIKKGWTGHQISGWFRFDRLLRNSPWPKRQSHIAAMPRAPTPHRDDPLVFTPTSNSPKLLQTHLIDRHR